MIHFFTFISLLLLLNGCETQRRQITEYKEENLTPSYLPSNKTAFPIDASIQRVAVLPISHETLGFNTLQDLQTILCSELNKRALFNVIPYKTYDESVLTSKLTFYDISTIYNQTQADAILIPLLTTYRQQPPLAIGLKLTLMDIKTGTVLWAFDDVFDAGLATVHYGAMRYAKVGLKAAYPFNEEHTILMSPRLFFQYASYEAFQSMTRYEN